MVTRTQPVVRSAESCVLRTAFAGPGALCSGLRTQFSALRGSSAMPPPRSGGWFPGFAGFSPPIEL
jgi:hypothetical protein